MYQVSYNVRMPDGSLRPDKSHLYDTILEARNAAESLTRQFKNLENVRIEQRHTSIQGKQVQSVWFDKVEQITKPFPEKQTVSDKYKDGGIF